MVLSQVKWDRIWVKCLFYNYRALDNGERESKFRIAHQVLTRMDWRHMWNPMGQRSIKVEGRPVAQIQEQVTEKKEDMRIKRRGEKCWKPIRSWNAAERSGHTVDARKRTQVGTTPTDRTSLQSNAIFCFIVNCKTHLSNNHFRSLPNFD